MSRTKIVAILTFAGSVISLIVDAFNGGGFDLKGHAAEIGMAAGSAGLYFLRDAIQKLQDTLGGVK